jgi:amylosucrase
VGVTYVDPMETAVRRRAADALQELLPSLTTEAELRLGRAEAVAFLARLETNLLDIYEPLDIIYGEPLLGRLVRVALEAAA